MKNALLFLLLVAVAGLAAVAALSMQQRSQLAQLRAELAAANLELRNARAELSEKADAERRISYAERKTQLLADSLTETSAAAVRQSEEMSQLQQFVEAAKTNSDTGKSLAGLFKDPAMKEMIKAQQKAYMGPMIDKMYADFFRQMNLTPEQSAAMKTLLEKKTLVAADMGMSAMDGSMDAAKRAELARQIKVETDAYDTEIRQFLGDDNYRQFQSYEQSVPDRMALSQLRDQWAGTTTALSGAQERQLVQAMYEERTAFKWTSSLGRGNPNGTGAPEMPNEEQLAKYAADKAQLDRRILERAGPILSPQQLAAFEQFQLNQSQMQISVMKLAGKMFAPASK